MYTTNERKMMLAGPATSETIFSQSLRGLVGEGEKVENGSHVWQGS